MEGIVAESMPKNLATGISEKVWHVHWKGHSLSAQTWEPLEHLSACEQFISRFNDKRQRQEQEYEQQRKKRKLDAEQSAATESAESLSHAALTSVALITPNTSSRRTSAVWLAFTDAPQPGFAQCTLQRKDGQPCNTTIKHCGRTTNLRSHLIAQHKEWYTQQMEKTMNDQASLQVTKTGTVDLATAPNWSHKKRDRSCRKLAYWLCTKKRPLHLVTDPEFQDFCMEISQKVDSCSEKEMDKQLLEIVATRNLHNKKTLSSLNADGIKPSMASEIWSDSDVSLMGTMLYYIDGDWIGLHAMLICATDFSSERHSVDNTRRQTEVDLESVGLTFDDIHAKVSDQGSNIQKAWGGLPRGYCIAHTLELAVKE